MLDEKKIGIAQQVQKKLEQDPETAEPEYIENDPCAGCPVGGGCIYTACGAKTA